MISIAIPRPSLRHARVLVCFLLGLVSFFSGAVRAEEIRIGGTGNALGTMKILGDAFMQANPGAKVTVLPSVGSSGALKAVPKGAIEIGLSSRTLTEEESRLGLVALEYAESPTVFATSNKVKATSITRRQLVGIYAGSLGSWPDGTPVRPILRQAGDDNTRQIKMLSPEIEAALLKAEQRPGMAFAVTDQDAADKMESIPGSLGVSTQALILSEKRSMHALSLDGVEPSLKNMLNGSYPLTKKFYLITVAAPAPHVEAFINFIRSPKGAEILARLGQVAR